MLKRNTMIEAMAAAGLAPAKELDLIDDGPKLHRYRVEGDKAGSTNGWYVLYAGPNMAGSFGSWRTRETHAWRGATCTPKTAAELAEWQRKMHEMQQARVAEQAKVQAAARDRAAKLWARAHPAHGAHPYLTRKQVPAIGVRQLRDVLLIPARDIHGELHTLQFIMPDGGKRFLTGGRISGCYFSVGRPLDSLLLCEGLATGLTLYAATGRAVAVCFTCGNLLPVARALRSKFPKLKFIICADNDLATPGNPGVTHARAAAQASGALLAVPDFSEVQP